MRRRSSAGRIAPEGVLKHCWRCEVTPLEGEDDGGDINSMLYGVAVVVSVKSCLLASLAESPSQSRCTDGARSSASPL